MPAWFVVRAVVSEPDRRDFDKWYRTEHLPDAAKAFAAETAWRAWSHTDPSVHYAYYRFPDVASAEAVEHLAGNPHAGRRVRCALGLARDAHARDPRGR